VTDDDDYTDLTAGALVHHPKYGTGRIQDAPWQYGQPLVKFDSGPVLTAYVNPSRLSTDDED